MSLHLTTPEEFFRDLVNKAKTNVSDDMKSYVVSLLTRYIRSEELFVEKDGKQEFPTLVFLYQEAINTSSSAKYQKLGDTALYISGFMPDSLNRKLVDVDYFAQMGSMAYEQVSVINQAMLFRKMAKSFSQLMDMLSEVSDFEPKDEKDLLRLYELYILTKSPRLKAKLIAKGINPLGDKSWI